MMTIKNRLISSMIFLCTLIIVSCTGTKLRDHYSGFVVDDTGAPIAGVSVREDRDEGHSHTTDSAGFFKIERPGKSVSDLIFSKNGYRTDTVDMVWTMHGEKLAYSGFVTKGTAKWEMREIVYRDSVLNWSDKLRFFDNDSIEMHRDERLIYTQYLNRRIGEIIYRHWNYNGKVEREVYSIDMTKTDQIHFRDYFNYFSDSTSQKGYLTVLDSIPDLLKTNLGDYFRIGVIKQMKGKQLFSEKYIVWRSAENCVEGQFEDFIGTKQYYDTNYVNIEKYTSDGNLSWYFYPNGKLKSHWISKHVYGSIFSSYSVNYDSLGNKTKEKKWQHLFPEGGSSYNDTFLVETTQNYYKNGKLKSVTKHKSFCESDSYRCGTWLYYNERGNVTKTEKYGDCYNFKLEEKYMEFDYSEE